ncbi:MAG: AEC family transporter [Clostridia bacterium]|nr:AEC family transporter [Clostridia bacterium]
MAFFGNVYTVFIQVMVLAVMVAVGFFGDRFGYFTEHAARLCNNLLFYVITPCVIVNSFLSVEYTRQSAGGFFTAFACALVFHALAAVFSLFLFRKGDRDKNIIYKYATVYGNTGYMGLPLAKAVMDAVAGNGEIGVFYCSAAVAAFNLFCFTHGVWLMSGSGGKHKFNWKKLIVNPGTLSVAAGLPLFLLNISLPQVLTAPIEHLGSMNTPLAMVMFGTYLSKADFGAAFRQKNMYVAALMKLAVIPLAMIGLFRVCGITGNLLIVASVFVSAPSANNTVMFAAKYNRDTSLASQVCGFTSVLSVITMPACVALAIMLA